MQKAFFQELMNASMFRKLTSAAPFLRKEKLDSKDIESAIRDLERSGFKSALEKSGQDPKEIADMTLLAFDESVKNARERFATMLNQMVEYQKKS